MTELSTQDFDYELPETLIAQQPLPERSASRLLVVDRMLQQLRHAQFSSIYDAIGLEDLLVINNTKVIPARLHGIKETGGKVECLVERVLNNHDVLAHLRSSKSPNAGAKLILESECQVTVLGRKGALFKLRFDHDDSVYELLDRYGHVPLPPYITREDDQRDRTRYQSIFAEQAGAVAAPTASLHFTNKLFDDIKAKGTAVAEITLHVGAGTFQPVRVDDLTKHHMHSEWIDVSQETVAAIESCHARGGRVIAVGTTVMRALETAARSGTLSPYQGDTDIFIYPGFKFRCVDALLTNFHLPKSTLLMLVSAFAGVDLMRQAYQSAVEHSYRFFSYGDAMLIL